MAISDYHIRLPCSLVILMDVAVVLQTIVQPIWGSQDYFGHKILSIKIISGSSMDAEYSCLYYIVPSPPLYRCNEESSSYLVCSSNNSTGMMSDVGAINGTQPMIPGTDVLDQLGVTLPFYGMYLLLIGSGLIYRILAYFALRYLHRGHH